MSETEGVDFIETALLNLKKIQTNHTEGQAQALAMMANAAAGIAQAQNLWVANVIALGLVRMGQGGFVVDEYDGSIARKVRQILGLKGAL